MGPSVVHQKELLLGKRTIIIILTILWYCRIYFEDGEVEAKKID